MEPNLILRFPPNISDRERHELTLQHMKKLQELNNKKAPLQQPQTLPNPLQQPLIQLPKPIDIKEDIITTVEEEEVPIQIERSWVCSNCKICTEWIQEKPDQCHCGCRHIFHLKEEDEYEPDCIDDYNYESEQEYIDDDEADEEE